MAVRLEPNRNKEKASKAARTMAALFAILGATLIGCSPIFVRMTDVDPISIGFYRCLIAAPMIACWIGLERFIHPTSVTVKPKLVINKRDILCFLFTGGCFALDIAFWHHSLLFTSVANSSLFNSFAAFIVPIAMWVVFREKPTFSFFLGVFFAMVGSFLVVSASQGIGSEGGMTLSTLKGDAFALTASLGFSGYIVGIKKLRAKFDNGIVMLLTTSVMAIILFFVAVVTGEDVFNVSARDWVILFSLAFFVHVMGQGFLSFSMKRVSAPFAALAVLIGPVVGSAIAWVLFSEKMVLQQFLGAGLILSSIIYAQMRSGK